VAAGALSTPIRVERRAASPDDRYGRGAAGAYAIVPDLAVEWARLVPKQGGEVALQSRLQQKQVYELLVRKTPATMTITGADRITTLDDLALEIDVKAAAPYQADAAYILITGETGVAHG
jgi:hypothetical protein